MARKIIDYKGRKDFGRPRKLVETIFDPDAQAQFEDLAPPVEDDRQDTIDKIYTDLANTFVKGDHLKNGLREMEPAQSIPIEPDATETVAAARRFDEKQSLKGKVITYSMYTNAVDSMLNSQWDLRLKYLNLSVPATETAQFSSIMEEKSDSDGASLIKEFIMGSGIAGTLLMSLCLAPFQSLIFQSLSGEEGAAKGIQLSQIGVGIALLIGFGLQAKEIIEMMKGANISSPDIETLAEEIENDDEKRRGILRDFGMDEDDIRELNKTSDAETIINYVNSYYERHGGLVDRDSHLTIDHWIAYHSVARSQQTIRSALNTADSYSIKFKEIRDRYSPNNKRGDSFIDETSWDDVAKAALSSIPVELASVTKALRERSNDMYDDIIDAFQYNVTDQDLCCLVQIFGAFPDVELMKSIAQILRFLAVDMSVHLVKLANLLLRMIGNLLQDALFELITQINEFYVKVLEKIQQVFTIDLGPELSACGGMLSIGWTLNYAMRVIFRQIRGLLQELSSIIGQMGNGGDLSFSWEASADRRHLLGISRVLQVLAVSIERANACANDKTKNHSDLKRIENVESANDAILSIVEVLPPVLRLPEGVEEKFFSSRKPRTSAALKYKYGIQDVQNPDEASDEEVLGSGTNKCSDAGKEAQIENLIKNLSNAFRSINE